MILEKFGLRTICLILNIEWVIKTVTLTNKLHGPESFW